MNWDDSRSNEDMWDQWDVTPAPMALVRAPVKVGAPVRPEPVKLWDDRDVAARLPENGTRRVIQGPAPDLATPRLDAKYRTELPLTSPSAFAQGKLKEEIDQMVAAMVEAGQVLVDAATGEYVAVPVRAMKWSD